MTVKELIAELQQQDQDRIVVMSKDGEGNGFSPLADMSTNSYAADSTYSGEIGLEELTEEHIKDGGYTEEDVLEGEKALVLWPTN